MNKRKTIIIVVCSLLALVLAVVGVAYLTGAERQTCNVYAVSDLAMDYWGEDNVTYGEVRSDNVQTVYLSDTQQVTEIYVTEGQTVRAGDKLLAYDTTLSALEVSRKEIEIKQLKEELTAAKKKYNTLAGSKVYTVAAEKVDFAPVQLVMETEPTYQLSFLTNVTAQPQEETQPPAEEEEEELPAVDENGVVRTYAQKGGTGTQEDPFLYVCADGVPFDEDFLREIGLLPPLEEEVPPEGETPPVEEQPENPENPEEAEEDPEPVYVVFGISEGNKLEGKILQAGGMCFSLKAGKVSFIVFDASDYIGRAFGEPKPKPELPDPPDPDDNNGNNSGNNSGNTSGGNTSGGNTSGGNTSGGNTSGGNTSGGNTSGGNTSGGNTSGGNTSGGNTSGGNTSGGNNSGNTSGGNTSGGNTSGGNTGGNTSGGNTSGGNTSGGSTSTGPSYAEIQAQKAELQTQIKELDLQLRMAEIELKRMNQELSDGVVYAELAGTISSLQEADAAYQSGEPLMKLAGGGGYYIEGTVSELELERVYVGQSVSVTSWETGEVYEGSVKEISQVPSENGYYSGMGNSNVSYYPFVVVIDGDANFREYEGVELRLAVEQEASDFFYLEQPFVLEEEDKHYVYLAGEDGSLEKREIVTGKALWGSSVQILEGLSREDAIAFPYGKMVREGAKTKLSTLDELYGW